MDFASGTYDVADAFAANELYQDNGWTDGLPIVPPTAALVRTFLEAARMAPGDVVAAEPCAPSSARCAIRGTGCTACPRPLVAARRSSSSMGPSGTRSA